MFEQHLCVSRFGSVDIVWKEKKMRRRTILVLAMVAVFPVGIICPHTASATVMFDDGVTHEIDYEISDDVWVDYLAPATHTTVKLVSGSRLIAPHALKIYEDGRADFCDGSMMDHESWLFAYNRSSVAVSGGDLSYFEMHDDSQIEVSGGSITGCVELLGRSKADISAGLINHLFAYENSQNYISGGVITYTRFFGNSQVDIAGGSIVHELVVTDGAIMTIYGSGFAIDGQPVAYGELTSMYGSSWSTEPSRRLTGTLASGEPLDNDFFIGNAAKIVLTTYYTLTINVEPNDVGIDTITPSVGPHDYAAEAWVGIKAERFVNCPDVYTFAHWEGDVNDPNSADTTVFMDSDKTITAVFVDGRQCGDECHPYPSGDVNKDCKVDFLDIAMVASSWLECTRPECD